MKGYSVVSDRILMVKLHGKPVDINLIQIYALASISTKEEIETFYSGLDKAVKECKKHEATTIMDDFNANSCKQSDKDISRGQGLGERNKRGDRSVVTHEMKLETLKQYPRHLWTRRSQDNMTKNQNRLYTYKTNGIQMLSCQSRPSQEQIAIVIIY